MASTVTHSQEANRDIGDEDTEDPFGGMRQKGKAKTAEIAEEDVQKQAKRQTQEQLDAYFGKDTQLGADDRFLKKYIMNQVSKYKGLECGQHQGLMPFLCCS